ncbi:hypothetical protein H0H81_010930 [Sphagnurus paluster]|uniref:Uncharacterized protein n=1 Tax=Sphagnurus paluster TaxID=117069 RepID=A0A9P7KHQ7_9AGAR|nr:hypothetical protein H0H81_010930 [Sphagnurus paluster]
MASPSDFSRRTASSYSLSPLKQIRPPIHNPYDKFTQPEFDAWIGGITGALKRALGQDEVEQPEVPEFLDEAAGSSASEEEEEVQRLIEVDIESSDEGVDDSFAKFHARRVGKGKARDPRDGPGFGKGGQDEPILIESDSEEEDGESDEAEKAETDEEEEEWEERSEDDERDEYWSKGESSVQARSRHERQQLEAQVEGEAGEEDDLEEYDDDDELHDGQEYTGRAINHFSSPVLIVDSEEEPDCPEGTVLGLHERPHDQESGKEHSDEDDDTSTSMLIAQTILETNPVGHREHYEEQPSSPIRKQQASVINLDDDERFQPFDKDTSFPTQKSCGSLSDAVVQITDPWAGPRTYAEDYYSGGDVPGSPMNVTSDHLGPNDPTELPQECGSSPLDVIRIDEEDDSQEVQPLVEDTSFPPVPINADCPVEIPDVWEGPETYAEDYYSGGDAPLIKGCHSNPHNLGENDKDSVLAGSESFETAHPSNTVDQPPDALIQFISPGTSFPSEFATSGLPLPGHPVDHPDPWDVEHHGDVNLITDNLGLGDGDHAPIMVDSDDEHLPILTKVESQMGPVENYIEDTQTVKEIDVASQQVNMEGDSPEAARLTQTLPQATFQTDQLDFSDIYDNIETDRFQDGPNQPSRSKNSHFNALTNVLKVDFSNINWEEASEMFKIWPISSGDQLIDPEVTMNEHIPQVQAESRVQVDEVTKPPVENLIDETPSSIESFFQITEVSDEGFPGSADASLISGGGSTLGEAPSPESLDLDPQTISVLSTSHHQRHQYGLPTPPSEGSKDILSHPSPETDELTCADKHDVEVESIELSTETIDIADAGEHQMEEIEDEGTAIDAKSATEINEAVSGPVRDVQAAEQSPTLDNTVELFSSENPDERETLVELDTQDTVVESNGSTMEGDQVDAFGKDGTAVDNTSPEVFQIENLTQLTADAILANALSPTNSLAVLPPVSIAMPVCADPDVPDPTSRPRTPSNESLINSLPGTPVIERPSPVSLPLPPSVLKALQIQSPQSTSSNGLFTPAGISDSGATSPKSATAWSDMETQDVTVEDQGPAVSKPPEDATLTSVPEPQGLKEIHATQELVEPVLIPHVKDTTPPVVEHQESQPEASSISNTSLPHHLPPVPFPLTVQMRKFVPTEPALTVDPFPASMSTPDNFAYTAVSPHPFTAIREQSPTENITSASSLGDTNIPNKIDAVLDASVQNQELFDLEEIELRYPSVEPFFEPNGQEGTTDEIGLLKVQVRNDVVGDADANGDADPDFVDYAGKTAQSIPTIVAPARVSETKVQENNGPHVSPRVVGLKAKPSARQKRYFFLAIYYAQYADCLPHSSPRPVPSGSTSMPVIMPGNAQSGELPSILIIKTPTASQNKTVVQNVTEVFDDDSEELTDLDETPAKPKPAMKRKRTPPTTVSPALTRSVSARQVEKKKISSRSATSSKRPNAKKMVSKDKGKGREVRALPASKRSFDNQSISSRSSSGASSALKIPRTSSRNTSRASSVVSSVPSENSSNTVQRSPTTNKGSSFRQPIQPAQPPPPPQPPLLHKHSHTLPHHHAHRPPPAPPFRPTPPQSISSPSQTGENPPADSITNRPSLSSQAPSHRAPVYYSSSPVTRSNCRYHKISIPREEDGPRIYFLVPGCSLGDSELIEEEEIEDHGDAQPEDGRFMTHDLDAFEFTPLLLSVLRQLVGPDMLREQEIYYLQQPGPTELVPRRQRPRIDEKLQSASARTHSSTEHGPTKSPRRPSTAAVTSPPISKASTSAVSVSTSASDPRPMKHFDDASSILSSDGELTEEDSPKAKRHKPLPAETKPGNDMGPPEFDSRQRNTRRSMRLGRDAAEYNPAEGDEEVDEEVIDSRRSKLLSKQGLKRTRTSDIHSRESASHKLKRQKTAPNG